MKSDLFELLGFASRCWDKGGVFESDKLEEAGNDFLKKYDRPWLGLATTGELLKELTARAEINGYSEYRTFGSKC